MRRLPPTPQPGATAVDSQERPDLTTRGPTGHPFCGPLQGVVPSLRGVREGWAARTSGEVLLAVSFQEQIMWTAAVCSASSRALTVNVAHSNHFVRLEV